MSKEPGTWCKVHGWHLGDECPECPYEQRIAELETKLGALQSKFCERHQSSEYFGRCPACVCDDLAAAQSRLDAAREAGDKCAEMNRELVGRLGAARKALEQWDSGEQRWVGQFVDAIRTAVVERRMRKCPDECSPMQLEPHDPSCKFFA